MEREDLRISTWTVSTSRTVLLLLHAYLMCLLFENEKEGLLQEGGGLISRLRGAKPTSVPLEGNPVWRRSWISAPWDESGPRCLLVPLSGLSGTHFCLKLESIFGPPTPKKKRSTMIFGLPGPRQ